MDEGVFFLFSSNAWNIGGGGKQGRNRKPYKEHASSGLQRVGLLSKLKIMDNDG